MKEKDPPDSDDDGWGDAAAAGGPPASEAAIDNEWDDPADLEKRVAALKEQQQAEASTQPGPETVAAEPEPPKVEKPSAKVIVAPDPAPGIATKASVPATEEESSPLAPSAEPSIGAARKDAEASPPASKRKSKKKKTSAPAKPGVQLTTRQKLFIGGGSIALVIAAVCAILGWFNSQNYYLSCGTETITAKQGRFWPWGESPLPGPAFRPIEVPRDVQCTNQHFDSRVLLEDAFLKVLLEQSTALLTDGDAATVTRAETQLSQALLLTRDPERAAQRADAIRLEGDVSYWRGAAQVQTATELLQESAKYFSEAASKRPRHTSDANAWAEHARFIESEIDKGPRALRKDDAPKEQPHFEGLSKSKEQSPASDDSSADVPVLSTPDAGVPAGPPDAGLPPDAALPPADAALPKGGVLL